MNKYKLAFQSSIMLSCLVSVTCGAERFAIHFKRTSSSDGSEKVLAKLIDDEIEAVLDSKIIFLPDAEPRKVNRRDSIDVGKSAIDITSICLLTNGKEGESVKVNHVAIEWSHKGFGDWRLTQAEKAELLKRLRVNNVKRSIPPEIMELLVQAKGFELLSIDPFPAPQVDRDFYRNWKVLGKTVVKTSVDSKKLVEELKESVAEQIQTPYNCFDPRHAIRISYDGKIVDLVTCFECHLTGIYRNGELEEYFHNSDRGEAEYDRVLREAQVPLAKKGMP